jgi:2'-5' RNA ligase
MPRIRTFIAINLESAVHRRVMALQETLARSVGDEVKWVEDNNMHLTLLFLGEVDQRQVHEVCRAVARCCAERESFVLEVVGVGAFPNTRRPRILWAGVGQGTEELVSLHDVLEEALLELGCYRREERKYSPHVTLGRVHQDGAEEKIVEALTRHQHWQGGETRVTEALVMSSDLTPRGPIYTVMSRAKLGG